VGLRPAMMLASVDLLFHSGSFKHLYWSDAVQTPCARAIDVRVVHLCAGRVVPKWSPAKTRPTPLPPPRPGRQSRRGVGVNGGRRPSRSDAKRHLLRRRDVDDRQADEGEPPEISSG
jgi:hypothetical protein